MSAIHNLKTKKWVRPFDAAQRCEGAACRFDGWARLLVSVCGIGLSLLFGSRSAQADSGLAVIRAGVQQSEDAPFVPADFRFMPGDYVYFTFDIAGFHVRTNPEAGTRHMSLTYEITPQDSENVSLAPTIKGGIDVDLNPEDKEWTPKRRASFLLPSYVAAGQYHLHVAVQDSIAKAETTADVPFLIGGVKVLQPDVITAQNFAFLRKENDREPLEVPAYSPGDTVFARFNLVGFRLGQKNEYNLSYGVTVLRPDGRPFLNNPQAAELKGDSFYPAKYLPGTIALTVPPNAERGQYVITLALHDLIGNRTSEFKQSFSIE